MIMLIMPNLHIKKVKMTKLTLNIEHKYTSTLSSVCYNCYEIKKIIPV